MQNTNTKITNQNDSFPKINFWDSEEAYVYRQIAENLLTSDIPAYMYTYHLLDVEGKLILDYGCHQGDSTLRILSLGAGHVVGVDTNEGFIRKALENYEQEALTFEVIDGSVPVPEGFSGYEGAAVTFIHSVIPSRISLKHAMKNISQVLISGAKAVFLGLHPNSFNSEYSYLSYKHSLQGNIYDDGVPFLNELIQGDQRVRFYDYCWTYATLEHLLYEVGFSQVREISLSTDVEGLEEMIKKVEKDRQVEFQDEFKAPLHQVIEAIK